MFQFGIQDTFTKIVKRINTILSKNSLKLVNKKTILSFSYVIPIENYDKK